MNTAVDTNEKRLLTEERNKLAEVMRLTRFKYLFWWLMRALGLIGIGKGLVYFYLMSFKYNTLTRGFGLDIEKAQIGNVETELYTFACLSSNCSSLFGLQLDRLRRDENIAKMPLFVICHQTLANLLYAPIEKEFAISAICFTLITAGFLNVELFIYRKEGMNSELPIMT